MEEYRLNHWKQKVLFTPGPLTTSMRVKQAMLRDVGSRDIEFIDTIAYIRQKIKSVAGIDQDKYEAILLQGSGTYSVEAVLATASPPDAVWLVIQNGAYGVRIAKTLDKLKIKKIVRSYPEDSLPDLSEISNTLESIPEITHVAVIHCETTTGLINPIRQIGELAKKYGKIFFVDAMSSFGAVPVDFNSQLIDYLACCANKNFEGVPGFGFVIAKKDVLLNTEGNANSLVLDLYDQWKGFERNGQFRFTPPTHSILAFKQALTELEEEGGIPARSARYRDNYETLVNGMRKLGFKEYLSPELQGHIIVSFRYPEHPNFDFDSFYNLLNKRGYVIYPGKVSNANCFRIGVCGRIFRSDILDLLNVIKDTIHEMDIELE